MNMHKFVGQTISALFLVRSPIAFAKLASMLRTFLYDTLRLHLCKSSTNFLLLVCECSSRARNTASGGSQLKFEEREVIWPSDSQRVSPENYFVQVMIWILKGDDGRNTSYVVEPMILRSLWEKGNCNVQVTW